MADCHICGKKNFKNKKSLGNHVRWHFPTEKLKKSVKGINNGMYGSNMKGKNNPHYGRIHTEETKQKMSLLKTKEKVFNGYKKSEQHRFRCSSQYQEWRIMVFGRDDYTCQNCNNRGCYLEAHHIKSFSKYPELRLDISNGITYCRDCHIIIDKHRKRFGD